MNPKMAHAHFYFSNFQIPNKWANATMKLWQRSRMFSKGFCICKYLRLLCPWIHVGTHGHLISEFCSMSTPTQQIDTRTQRSLKKTLMAHKTLSMLLALFSHEEQSLYEHIPKDTISKLPAIKIITLKANTQPEGVLRHPMSVRFRKYFKVQKRQTLANGSRWMQRVKTCFQLKTVSSLWWKKVFVFESV